MIQLKESDISCDEFWYHFMKLSASSHKEQCHEKSILDKDF